MYLICPLFTATKAVPIVPNNYLGSTVRFCVLAEWCLQLLRSLRECSAWLHYPQCDLHSILHLPKWFRRERLLSKRCGSECEGCSQVRAAINFLFFPDKLLLTIHMAYVTICDFNNSFISSCVMILIQSGFVLFISQDRSLSSVSSSGKHPG